MDWTLRKIAIFAGLLLMAGLLPGVAAATDAGSSPARKPGRETPAVDMPLADRAPHSSRAVFHSLGEPRTVPGKPAAVIDDIEAIPLGGLSAQEAPATRTRRIVAPVAAGMAVMVAHDCALAENGDAAAAYRLGRRYLFGMGVTRDKRMGVAWMRAAASRGHAPAIQIASLVPRNIGRMRPWCRANNGPAHQPSPPPAQIVKLVQDLAPTYGLDPGLVLAVIQVESAYHTNAVSPKEAAGLMQLIPDTAERFGVHNVFEPAENIRGGMKYLRWLLAYFEGNVTLALAGYNAGEHAVDRYGGVPPYAETQAYVRLIHRLYPKTGHRFDPNATGPSARFARQTADAAR